MSESKELLEATIKGLEEKLESVKSDLGMKVRELEDVNKPVMTDVMFEKLTQLVEDAVNEVSLDDPSHFADKIMSEVDGHYKIIATSLDKE